jgi:hypothetical protein
VCVREREREREREHDSNCMDYNIGIHYNI